MCKFIIINISIFEINILYKINNNYEDFIYYIII